MSQADLRKWDARYRDGAYADREHPTALLAQFFGELARGRALDVACGAGRNSLFLAKHGFAVDAIDISSAALERLESAADSEGLQIRTVAADLEGGIADSSVIYDGYDLILMVRYVNQALIPKLTQRLAPGGVFISEEHLQTVQDVVGPRNSDYRLAPGQLLQAVLPLRVHYYREGIVTDPDGRRAALAQVIASRDRTEFDLD